MSEELISFETAKLAKEKGFTEVGYHYWSEDGKQCMDELSSWMDDTRYPIGACSQSSLQKWLRDNHRIVLIVKHNSIGRYSCDLRDHENSGWARYFVTNSKMKKTYEQALEAGLKEALKLIKDE